MQGLTVNSESVAFPSVVVTFVAFKFDTIAKHLQAPIALRLELGSGEVKTTQDNPCEPHDACASRGPGEDHAQP